MSLRLVSVPRKGVYQLTGNYLVFTYGLSVLTYAQGGAQEPQETHTLRGVERSVDREIVYSSDATSRQIEVVKSDASTRACVTTFFITHDHPTPPPLPSPPALGVAPARPRPAESATSSRRQPQLLRRPSVFGLRLGRNISSRRSGKRCEGGRSGGMGGVRGSRDKWVQGDGFGRSPRGFVRGRGCGGHHRETKCKGEKIRKGCVPIL